MKKAFYLAAALLVAASGAGQGDGHVVVKEPVVMTMGIKDIALAAARGDKEALKPGQLYFIQGKLERVERPRPLRALFGDTARRLSSWVLETSRGTSSMRRLFSSGARGAALPLLTRGSMPKEIEDGPASMLIAHLAAGEWANEITLRSYSIRVGFAGDLAEYAKELPPRGSVSLLARFVRLIDSGDGRVAFFEAVNALPR